jgi:hypothetical protein
MFIFSILFYFFGRCGLFANNKLFDNLLYIFPVFFIIVLFLHLYSPSWYIAIKANMIFLKFEQEMNDSSDFMRLTGFNSHPYEVSYGVFLFISYLLYKKSFYNWNISLYLKIQTIVALIAQIFAMQRGPLLFTYLSFIIFSFLTHPNHKNKFFYKRALFICGLIVIIVQFNGLINWRDHFGLSKGFEERLSTINMYLINERFNLFKDNFNLSFLGKGFGYYEYEYANAMDLQLQRAITDNEYIKMIGEFGVAGTLLFVTIIIFALYKAFIKMKYNIFEIYIILVYFIFMTGFCPLTRGFFAAYGMIFWFCIGRISNNHLYTWKKENMCNF